MSSQKPVEMTNKEWNLIAYRPWGRLSVEDLAMDIRLAKFTVDVPELQNVDAGLREAAGLRLAQLLAEKKLRELRPDE